MAKESSITVRPYEIRWHGRGGQGAITAAKIVAQAAYLDGYQGVTAAPSFGAERRGAYGHGQARSIREIRRNQEARTSEDRHKRTLAGCTL